MMTLPTKANGEGSGEASSKRVKLEREDKPSFGPPQIRRSMSMINLEGSHDTNFVSPQRTYKCVIDGGQEARYSKFHLNRSQSFSESTSRKSLDFSDDSCMQQSWSSTDGFASNDSFNSAYSDKFRIQEQDSFKKWTDSFPNRSRKKYFNDSPEELQAPDINSELAANLSHLDVSKPLPQFQLPPPPPLFGQVVTISARLPSAKIVQSNFQLGPYETPTREQSLLLQCGRIDVTNVVDQCKKNVRIVVLDLDQTLLDIHTKGRWAATSQTLGTQHIRPVFRKLLPEWLKAGIPVGIATFSPQEALVESMLTLTFEDVEINRNVFVRGFRSDDQDNLSQQSDDEDGFGHDFDNDTGKRRHIQCILDRLPEGGTVSAQEVLFVDDDESNISSAKKDGHRVVHFRESWTDELFLKNCLSALQDSTSEAL